jgi:iron complex outermembrane receptor protein
MWLLRYGLVQILAACAFIASADAQELRAPGAELRFLDIVGVSPLGGSQSLAKVPANVQSIDSSDITQGVGGVAGALDRRISSVGATATTGNDLQPGLTYRGFEASPNPGAPQGVAVYQNGVRINEAFGDSVNWDFIPSNAVARADVGGNNPTFGLNALGGAVRLKMKDGFNYRGAEVEAEGGSFGRVSTAAQFGKQVDNAAAYGALETVRDGGFRLSGTSNIKRFYGDIGLLLDAGEVHVNLSTANNSFGASAAAPAELLQKNWSAIYTSPQATHQRMTMANVTGRLNPGASWSIDANAYVRSFERSHVDGNTTEVASCGDGFLCFGGGGATANGADGAALVDGFNGAQLGQIDRSRTRSQGLGGAVQATNSDPLLARSNRLQFGVSLDYATTRFDARSELGVIGPDFRVAGSGIFLGPSGEPVSIGPVLLDATSINAGAWVSDTLDITKDLAATLGGRFNMGRVRLWDQLGGDLNGVSRVQRFNPMAGLTYRLAPQLRAYVGGSQASRSPTPLELGCANPLRPCIVDTVLVSDPPLQQVVATTFETGLRGSFLVRDDAAPVSWKAGVFRTNTQNEILSIPSAIQGFGYFANVGGVRRQGLELDIAWRGEQVNLFMGYTWLDATFTGAMTLSSPNNPRADGDGEIHVAAGDRLPMSPRHRLKAGFDYAITPAFKVRGDVIVLGQQYFEGDAANLNAPLPAYFAVNSGVSYQVNKTFELFAKVENLLDRRYSTFGTYFDTQQISFAGFTDPRTFSPARPRSFYAGARATF